MRPKDKIQQELDAVVGKSYDPPRRWGATIAKWVLAAVLGIGASAVIIWILDVHLRKAKTEAAEAAAKRPVPVRIIPEKKP